MNSTESPAVSKGTRKLMLAMLGAMVLLSIYANVQRWRRAQVEKTIITPASSSAISPAASP